MQLRRCAVLYIEPRETLDFDLASLLSGGDGLAVQRQWVALAPHIGEEVEIDDVACVLLGNISAHGWTDTKTCRKKHARFGATCSNEGC